MSDSAVAPTPVKKVSKKKELSTEDIKIDQPSPIGMPLDEPFERPQERIVLPEHPSMNKNYLDELAFNEEPVTIVMLPPVEKFGAQWVDCWVQGKGVEVLIEGLGWVEFRAIEVGKQVVVKRKYVEVWARAKQTNVSTKVTGNMQQNEEPVNEVIRNTMLKHPFQVIHDPNPKGAAWLQKIVSGRV